MVLNTARAAARPSNTVRCDTLFLAAPHSGRFGFPAAYGLSACQPCEARPRSLSGRLALVVVSSIGATRGLSGRLGRRSRAHPPAELTVSESSLRRAVQLASIRWRCRSEKFLRLPRKDVANERGGGSFGVQQARGYIATTASPHQGMIVATGLCHHKSRQFLSVSAERWMQSPNGYRRR